MHPHPRQNNTFTGLSGGCEALLAAPYRFTFNGQERTNEIAGTGNHTTALYWEYDTRLGRRWNVDPVVKPWQSNYVCFSNSPIWKVDPDGDDDYFNADGTFSHSTKTGSKIFVQTAKGNVLLTKINLNTKMNRQIVANVIGYYANLVGITFQGKGSLKNAGKGIVGLKASTKPSDENPAFTEGNNIYINKKDGKISKDLHDANNLKSTLLHEKEHKEKEQGFEKTSGDNFDHAIVYFNQVSDFLFLNATPEFQKGILNSMADYLKKASTTDGYQDSEIQGMVDKTNATISKTGFSLQFRRYSMDSDAINVFVTGTK